MGPWPRWAIAQVHVQPAQAAWQRRGEHLSRQLDTALAPWLVAPLAHVGSTAVPGLAAKPILDVQAAVLDFAVADPVARVLAPDGWHLVPAELDARPYRRFLVLVVDDHRAAHLHLLLAAALAGGSSSLFVMRCGPIRGSYVATRSSSRRWPLSTPTTARRTRRARPSSYGTSCSARTPAGVEQRPVGGWLNGTRSDPKHRNGRL